MKLNQHDPTEPIRTKAGRYLGVDEDPTVCLMESEEFGDMSEYETALLSAIDNWSSKLKEWVQIPSLLSYFFIKYQLC